MTTFVAVVAFVLLGGAILLAISSLLRGYLQGLRLRRGPMPPSVPEVNPPDPVVRTASVTVVGTAAIAWSLAHLVLIGLWAATGRLFGRELVRDVYAAVVAAYAAAAALLVALGGSMLLSANPHGRRAVAWGEFLFALLVFMGGVLAVMLPGDEQAPAALRRLAPSLLAGLAAHLAIDAVLGSAAQQAGRPPRGRS